MIPARTGTTVHLHNNATSLTQTNLNTVDLDPLGYRERRMRGNHKTRQEYGERRGPHEPAG